MDRKIALLRGINVGGKRKILMADLKLMFCDLGFTDVITYIQSGNVIFNTPEADVAKLENRVEQAILERFGFDVPVIIRTSKELEYVYNHNPFFNESADVKCLYLTFLKEHPQKESIEQIALNGFEPDRFEVVQREVYVYCVGKYHKSKLSNIFFEKKLLVTTTTRNWNTLLKLIDLAR